MGLVKIVTECFVCTEVHAGMVHERAHRWLLISMNSRSTWNYFSLCQSIMRLKNIIHRYIMHKKGTSLRLPVLFTKFRPPKIRRNILLQNPFLQLKTRQFCEREKTFGGNVLPLFNTAFFGLSVLFYIFQSFLKACGQLMINLFWDYH